MIKGDERQVILNVVRGTLPWTAIQVIGIEVDDDRLHWEMKNPSKISVSVLPDDVALGYIANASRPSMLKDWARFILASSAFVTLPESENAAWNHLLDAIWDASRDGNADAEMLEVARALVDESMQHRNQSDEVDDRCCGYG